MRSRRTNLPEPFKFVNPRYYNWITKTLILAGITLLAKPLWREILNASLDNLGIKISDKYEPIYGLIVIFIALVYNLVSQYFTIIEISKKEIVPQKQISKCKTYKNFYELCESLIPLIDDNKFLFKTFGPNSSAIEIEPLRYDLTLWKNVRVEYIIPNNVLIKCIINKNKSIIPTIHKDLFEKLIAHIYAFRKHVEDPNFDYENYQFPVRIEYLIKDYCYNINTKSKLYNQVVTWLNNKLWFKEIYEMRLIGSFLFSTLNANDLDILILLNIDDDKKIIQFQNKVQHIEYLFKLKFEKNIHFTVFTLNEGSDYNQFLLKNNYNYLLDGKRFTLFNFAFYKKRLNWT